MKVYYDKIEGHRKKFKITIPELCDELDIVRVTYWKWKTGKTAPAESKVRKIAQILKINVNEISDIEPDAEASSVDISQNIDSWLLLGGKKEEQRINEQKLFQNLLEKHQRELRQASILTRALLSSIETCFYVKDVNSKFILANDAFLDMVGLDKERDVLGLTDTSFFSKQEAERNIQQDLQVIATGDSLKYEGYTPNGRKRKWSIIYKSAIFDVKGKIAGLIGVFVDITKRKKEESLRMMLENCINTINDVITVRDFESNTPLFLNKAAQNVLDMYKGGNEEYLSWIEKNIHPEEKERELEYAKYKNWPERRTLRIIDNDGLTKFLEAYNTITSYRNRDCRITVVRDITDKKESEKVKELLKKLLDNSELAVSITAVNNNVQELIYANKAVKNIYGYPPENFYKKKDFWINNCLHPDYVEREKKYREKKKWPANYYYKIIDADGNIKWIENKTITEQGCLLGMERDVTDKFRNDLRSHFIESIQNKSKTALYAINRKNWVIAENQEVPFLLKLKKTKFNILTLNSGIEDISGYLMKHFLEDPQFWLSILHPDDKEKEIEYFSNASWPEKRRYRIISKSGKIRTIQSTFYKSSGEYDYAVDKDITELINECSIDIAKKLLKNGICHNIIENSTGLSKEDIDNLNSQLKRKV
jgi:PAS domain S-box-containing protein